MLNSSVWQKFSLEKFMLGVWGTFILAYFRYFQFYLSLLLIALHASIGGQAYYLE